ncbi:hypothetical protein AYO22_08871 [Fonsecaea multimorphosa]|nr:hypothetical protein AYO22_08871 [Fonsecaea multimorphosa]
MSTASKITLLSTILGTAGVVAFVHWAQTAEQAAMHAGVVRDMEQQRVKRERQADFDMQRQLEEEYKKVQTVHDRPSTIPPDHPTPRARRVLECGHSEQRIEFDPEHYRYFVALVSVDGSDNLDPK